MEEQHRKAEETNVLGFAIYRRWHDSLRLNPFGMKTFEIFETFQDAAESLLRVTEGWCVDQIGKTNFQFNQLRLSVLPNNNNSTTEDNSQLKPAAYQFEMVVADNNKSQKVKSNGESGLYLTWNAPEIVVWQRVPTYTKFCGYYDIESCFFGILKLEDALQIPVVPPKPKSITRNPRSGIKKLNTSSGVNNPLKEEFKRELFERLRERKQQIEAQEEEKPESIDLLKQRQHVNLLKSLEESLIPEEKLYNATLVIPCPWEIDEETLLPKNIEDPTPYSSPYSAVKHRTKIDHFRYQNQQLKEKLLKVNTKPLIEDEDDKEYDLSLQSEENLSKYDHELLQYQVNTLSKSSSLAEEEDNERDRVEENSSKQEEQ